MHLWLVHIRTRSMLSTPVDRWVRVLADDGEGVLDALEERFGPGLTLVSFALVPDRPRVLA